MHSFAASEDWQQVCLYDLARWTNGLAFRDFHFSPVGKPIIKIAELKGGVSGQTKFTEQEFDPRFRVTDGDLLFSWSGNPETSIDAFWWHGTDGWLNQHVFKVEPKMAVNSRFLFYILKYCKPTFTRIASNKQTTGLGHVTVQDMKELLVLLPPLDEQHAIAAVLGALDDKIELNRRMNATLEAMARALFKSWFVDFDPVRAKMEGRTPYGMDAATAALFPAAFADTPIGPIPTGWQIKPLDSIAEYTNGLAMQKYPSDDDGSLPVIKIAELNRGVTAASGRASTKLPPKYIVRDGDMLFSWSGSLVVTLWSGGLGALNQHLFKVTSAEYPRWFYYFWTLNHLPDFQGIAAGKATTMGHIQRHHLTAALTIIPPHDLLSRMNGSMTPLLNLIVANNIESRTLATIRDALLPKLLSGAVRMRDAARIVEAAV